MIPKKVLIALGLAAPLVCIASVAVRDIRSCRECVVFPAQDSTVTAYCDRDHEPDGKSVIRGFDRSGDAAVLRYELRDGCLRPYAGIRFDLAREGNYSGF